jgi:hypothetical protein
MFSKTLGFETIQQKERTVYLLRYIHREYTQTDADSTKQITLAAIKSGNNSG